VKPAYESLCVYVLRFLDAELIGLALVGEFLAQGKTHDAIAFRDYDRESGIDCGTMLLDWGKVYTRLGSKNLAADYFAKVLLLEPSNGEAADRLKELGDLKSP
jgi:hypothetical protein